MSASNRDCLVARLERREAALRSRARKLANKLIAATARFSSASATPPMTDKATPGSNRATAPTVPMELHTSDPATRFWIAQAIRCSGSAIKRKRSVRMERFTRNPAMARTSRSNSQIQRPAQTAVSAIRSKAKFSAIPRRRSRRHKQEIPSRVEARRVRPSQPNLRNPE